MYSGASLPSPQYINPAHVSLVVPVPESFAHTSSWQLIARCNKIQHQQDKRNNTPRLEVSCPLAPVHRSVLIVHVAVSGIRSMSRVPVRFFKRVVVVAVAARKRNRSTSSGSREAEI